MADLSSILYGQGQWQPGMTLSPDAPAPAPQAMPEAAPPQMAPPQAPVAGVPPPQATSQTPQPPAEDGGFMSLLDKVRSDPALSQAALMAGVRLAQGARPGQSLMGLVGDTVMMGSTAYQMLKGNERANGIQDANTALTQEHMRGQNEGQQLKNEETKATMPDVIKAAKLRAEALVRKGEVDKARQVFDVTEAQLRSAYAGTDAGALEILTSIKQDVLGKAREELRKDQDSGSQIALRGAQTEHTISQTETDKAKRENPEKYQTAERSGQDLFVTKTIERLQKAYGLTEAEATRRYFEGQHELKSATKQAAYTKFLLENSNGTPAQNEKAKNAFENMWSQSHPEESAPASAPTAAPAAKPNPGAKLSGQVGGGAPAPQGKRGPLTLQEYQTVSPQFSDDKIRADAAAAGVALAPEVETAMKSKAKKP